MQSSCERCFAHLSRMFNYWLMNVNDVKVSLIGFKAARTRYQVRGTGVESRHGFIKHLQWEIRCGRRENVFQLHNVSATFQGFFKLTFCDGRKYIGE